jgi:hypothetical protein
VVRLGLAPCRNVRVDKQIARTPAACGFLRQDSLGDEIADVPERRVPRAFGELRPFRRNEFALEAIKQAADHRALTVVESSAGMLSQETSLPEKDASIVSAR